MNERQRIMVIDDNREMLKILNRALEMEGFKATMVPDGSSALALLEETDPDLIVLDIMMPGLDGLQTLGLIRERSEVPVIMLTARAEVTALQQSMLLGADDFIAKPFSTKALIARIRAKLRRTRREVTLRSKN